MLFHSCGVHRPLGLWYCIWECSTQNFWVVCVTQWNWGHLLSPLFTIYMFDFIVNSSYLYLLKLFVIIKQPYKWQSMFSIEFPASVDGNSAVFDVVYHCYMSCLFVRAITFEVFDIEISFLEWWNLVQVRFEYQNHWVKVKVTRWKMLILLPGHMFNLVSLVWAIIKVKVI